MNVYPIFLNDLHNRHCIVIGGTHEAERKVESLIAVYARVTVINETVSERIQALAEDGCIHWIQRPYQDGDLAGAFLVICEGFNEEENAQVWAEGEREGILVNVMDDIPRCNFVAGSVVKRGPITISISSSGDAPTLAVRLRQQLEKQITAEYGTLAAMLGAMRPAVKANFEGFRNRRDRWYQLVDSDILALVRQQDESAIRERITEIFDVEAAEAAIHYLQTTTNLDLKQME